MRAFNEIHWYDYKEQFFKRISDEILKNPKEYVLQVDEEQYIEYLISNHSLSPLAIILDSEHIGEPTKSKRRIKDHWGDDYELEEYNFKITYNFTGSSELFKVKPSTSALISNDIEINSASSRVSYSIKVANQDVEKFKRAKSDGYSAAFTNLNYINSDVSQIINGLESYIRSTFQQVKASYKTENDFFAAIKVKTNPNTTAVFTAPTIKLKEAVKPIMHKGEFSSEPTMSSKAYEELLDAIYQFGKNMEKKPSLYKKKDEEGLRDQFVLMLETKYQDATATGETFNRNGKTDIILKYAEDGSNLFVAECKLWHGASEFHKAISQIFDNYLTWRDSKVALLFFVPNTGFTNVLTTIESEVVKHPYYKSKKGKRGESSFSYVFSLPQDKEKDVQVEIMAFHYDKK